MALSESHTHTHSHSLLHHAAPASGTTQRNLILTIGITVAILVIEVAGGLVANSLALLSDAGHVFTDLAALIMSLAAIRLAARPATMRKTFGFHRFEILSALINGVTLVLIAIFIFVEAYQRLRNPQPVAGMEVFVVAVLGLIGNGVGMLFMRNAGDNLNVRGAFLHLAGDAISSVGVIASAVVIMLTGWTMIDTIVSVLIGLIISAGAIRLIDESVDVLLEGTPRNIDMQEVIAEIMSLPGVCSVHDMHIWCVTPQLCTMSTHIIMDPDATVEQSEVLSAANHVLVEHFGITHSTIQIEEEHCGRSDDEWLAAQ